MRILRWIALLLAPMAALGQGDVATVTNLVALLSRIPSTQAPVVSVQGYYAPGDWGDARSFRYFGGDTNEPDNGCVFQTITGTGRWKALDCGGWVVPVGAFGAIVNDGVDDTAALTNAVWRASSRFSLVAPKGVLDISGPIPLYDNLVFHGSDWLTDIRAHHNGNGFENPGIAAGGRRIFNVILSNFRLTTASGVTGNHAFHFVDVSDSTFRRLATTGGAGNGWKIAVYSFGNHDNATSLFGGSWRNELVDGEFYVTGGPGTWGFYGDGGPGSTGGPNDWVIVANYFNGLGGASNPSEGGAYINNANHTVFTGNRLEGFWTNGVVLGTNNQSHVISYNRFERSNASDPEGVIVAREWTRHGHMILQNHMLDQGAPGSTNRIAPSDFPGFILDTSFEGVSQIPGNLLVGRHPLQGVVTTTPLSTSLLGIVDTNLLSTNALFLGSLDGVVNPRALVIQRTMATTNLLQIQATAGSGLQVIEFLTGSKTNAIHNATGTGINHPTVFGNSLTVGGVLGAGNPPVNPQFSGWAPNTPTLSISSTNASHFPALFIGSLEGTNNSRLILDVNGATNQAAFRTAGATGNRVPFTFRPGTIDPTIVVSNTATFFFTNVVIRPSLSLTFGGEARTNWPSGGNVYTSSNNVFTGTNTFSGPTSFDQLLIGTLTVQSNLFVPQTPYGPSWNGSSNAPSMDALYDKIESSVLPPGATLGMQLIFDGTNLVWGDSFKFWEMSHECGAGIVSGDFIAAGGNGGGAFSANAGELGHPGILQGSTGNTSTNGYTAYMSRANAIVGGGGNHSFRIWIKTPGALPTSEPYRLLVGFHDSNTGLDPVDAAGFFRLTPFADSWQCVTMNNNAITTNSVTYPAATNTWYHLRADVATGGSNVMFYVNGTVIATNTANIPTGVARAYGAGIQCTDDAGGTATNTYNQLISLDSIRALGVR
jgi:hypothetical protein